jgi:hypothetical protein
MVETIIAGFICEKTGYLCPGPGLEPTSFTIGPIRIDTGLWAIDVGVGLLIVAVLIGLAKRARN